MRKLLLMVHEHGGNDITCKPRKRESTQFDNFVKEIFDSQRINSQWVVV